MVLEVHALSLSCVNELGVLEGFGWEAPVTEVQCQLGKSYKMTCALVLGRVGVVPDSERRRRRGITHHAFLRLFFEGTDGFPMPLKAFPKGSFEQDWSPRGSASCTPQNQQSKTYHGT